ncbi:MAG: FAD-dependent oxidoreductase [Candidatus Gottesmanbacteria bacterium]|nr:FAD-dependent oxidoreductase [Candidatus Gottesmanbacteria bacterium]
MKVAVIGGGFTGLTAAYELTKRGYIVTLFEQEKALGGLARGFKESGWSWYLEYTYHHWFTNDRTVLNLIKELGLINKLITARPVTASLYKGEPYQLDSPMHLFTFPGLSTLDKFRTAALLGFLKFNPFWKPLENITSEQLLTSIGGSASWRMLWEPLLIGKFGDFAPKIQAAWFWARIKKRTSRLMYMKGGFKTLIDALENAIKKQGGKILMNKKLDALPKGFDKILLTVPTSIALKISSGQLADQIESTPHLTAQTLILETDKPIFKDVYWLNITDRSFPFLAAVAHTNFMDTKYYGGHHLTYFGNYLPADHPYLSMTKEHLLKKFMPFIKRLSDNSLPASPAGGFTIHNSFMFVAPFAQPVHELHYSSRAPKLETAITNIYLANMDSIVPWDRGINYAIELGQKAAAVIASKYI